MKSRFLHKMLKRNDILSSKYPLVFKNVLNWELVSWSIKDWENNLGMNNDRYPFRKGYTNCSADPLWETKCETELLTMEEFFNKFNTASMEDDTSWLYFDYKHISSWFSDSLKDISWNCVGFPERCAKDSTLWIGTKNAHTPCHMDTYGCNIVGQIYGKKMWILFDPSQSEHLSPTRVPYEESSVYSRINFACTCHPFPDIKEARCVVLEPGDVLYVPNHWWHYVENVTSAISVNTWIPVESDDESRLHECLVKFFISSVVKELDTKEVNAILNPNERDLMEFKIDQNVAQLGWCLEQVNKSENKSEEISVSDKMTKTNKYTVPIQSLHDIMKHKQKCRNPKEIQISNDDKITIKHVINAFCHPDMIVNVTKKLYNELNINK